MVHYGKQLAFILLLSASAFAQGGTATQIRTGSSLPTNCSAGGIFYKTTAPIGTYECSVPGSPGAWRQLYNAGYLLLQTNGVDNGSQTKLNLVAGTNVTLTDSGTGNVMIDASGGGGSGTVTSFSSGNLTPLFTTSVATATTTPALSFSLSNAAAHKFFGNNTGGSAAPDFESIGTTDLPFTYSGNTTELGTVTGVVTSGHLATWDASGNLQDGGVPSGGGTVTSVAMTVPTGFTVTGSPVTTSGTLAVTADNESANTVWAGPTTGAAAAPGFRALVAADLPLATTSAFGAVKPDGTTITVAAGVISASTGASGAMILLEEHTVSGGATVDFTTRNVTGQSGASFQSDFDTYKIVIVNIVPATNASQFGMVVSTDGGSTWDTGANYSWTGFRWVNSGSGANGSTGDTAIRLTQLATEGSNNGSYGIRGEMTIFDPLNATKFKPFQAQVTQFNNATSTANGILTSAYYKSNTAINALRFAETAGNVTGTIRLYGISK